MSILGAFNNQIDNLIEDLVYVYPDDKQLVISKEKFDLIRKVHPKKVLENFIFYIYPYKENIIAKDDNFFVNNVNNKTEIQENKYIDLGEALNLKNLWTDMKNENKQVVWNYFSVLIKLTEKYLIDYKQ